MRADRSEEAGSVRTRARCGRAAAAAVMVATALMVPDAMRSPAEAQSTEKIYTMAKYPVEAQARDAVAARTKAVADGQRAALRSLMKRLVPVTQYARLRKIATPDASRMVDSLLVRSERNSTVAYAGTLDFKFQPQAVRALLEKEGFAVVDRQAPDVVIVPIWKAPAAGDFPPVLGPTEGPRAWTDVWKGLDLEHALAPGKLDELKAGTHQDTLSALARGDLSMWRTFASAYQADRLIAVIAEPDIAARRLNVTLIGTDAVGPISWTRAYRIDPGDPGYTIELAGVVSLGVLEGRWKAVSLRGGASALESGGTPRSMGGDGAMIVLVEFRDMAEWSDISRALSNTPGVEDLDVLGLGGRSARVTLRYAAGAERLSALLGRQGYTLRNAGANWVLSAR